jgi:hypothetical protein
MNEIDLNWKRFWDLAVDWGWVVIIALLPITSVPLIATLVGSSSVAAPSGLVIVVFVVVWLVPYILRGGSFPKQVLPLLGFVAAALFAAAFASFLPIPPFNDINFFRHTVQAYVTLGIGVSFYLVASTYPSTSARLTLTLRLVNWGGAAIILWSMILVTSWYTLHEYPEWINNIQGVLSISDLGKYKQRISGFAAEPSWLAHQLNMLYLPLWLASSVRRYSVHRFRFLGFTFENLLLVSGCFILFLTYSRVGLLTFLLMLGYLMLKVSFRFINWLQTKTLRQWYDAMETSLNKWIRLLISMLILLLMLAIFLALLYAVALSLSQVDPRMEEVFQFDIGGEDALLRYGQRLEFGPRLVYWMAGWEVFGEYPWLGVGLGNAGYFFQEKISPYGWNLMEVREMVYRSGNLINIKNLWIRILAETGVIGFSFFATWLYVIYRSARMLEKYSQPRIQVIGLAGIFVIIGLIAEGFSVDTFALPYYWITLGLTTVTSRHVMINSLTSAQKSME